MFILLINYFRFCLIDGAKVRRFWGIRKYLGDFRLRLWRQGRGSATKCRRRGGGVSQISFVFTLAIPQ